MKIIIIIIALLLTVNCYAYDDYWDGGKIWDSVYFMGGGLIGIYSYEIAECNYFESVLIAASMSFVKEILDELYYRNIIYHNKFFNSFFDPYHGFSGRDILICGLGAATLTLPISIKKKFCLGKKKSMGILLTKKTIYIACQLRF